MTSLTWDELDGCKNSFEIADLLQQHGIRGIRYGRSCPLARATGWEVGSTEAISGEGTVRDLTYAERVFVMRFDAGDYPELEGDPEE